MEALPEREKGVQGSCPTYSHNIDPAPITHSWAVQEGLPPLPGTQKESLNVSEKTHHSLEVHGFPWKCISCIQFPPAMFESGLLYLELLETLLQLLLCATKCKYACSHLFSSTWKRKQEGGVDSLPGQLVLGTL